MPKGTRTKPRKKGSQGVEDLVAVGIISIAWQMQRRHQRGVVAQVLTMLAPAQNRVQLGPSLLALYVCLSLENHCCSDIQKTICLEMPDKISSYPSAETRRAFGNFALVKIFKNRSWMLTAMALEIVMKNNRLLLCWVWICVKHFDYSGLLQSDFTARTHQLFDVYARPLVKMDDFLKGGLCYEFIAVFFACRFNDFHDV